MSTTLDRPAMVATAPILSIVVPCYKERANVRPLVAALEAALDPTLRGAWEVIFVDDDSPDGTTTEIRTLAAQDTRVRGLRRVGRRGLSSAVIEGVMASSAEFVAVMDGDLQHDETRLAPMLQAVRSGSCDIAVGSRHVAGGDNDGLSNAWRHRLSDGGIRMAQAMLPVRLGDPMSGYFACRRDYFDEVTPRLSAKGFKILLDLILSARTPPRVVEIPCHFKQRAAGESKLDALVLVQFIAMLLDKAVGGLLPTRFIAFAVVGATGVAVNILVLDLARYGGLSFSKAQLTGTLVAILVNFALDNSLTYRDRRLTGARFWLGLLFFIVVCSAGALANVGIARALFIAHRGWGPASAAGAVIGVVWNYAVSSTLVWRRK
ncbi:glycosyltransferase [Lichenicoccus roseus]|uniref:Glycosyltransferase n=1 Tax=Lichenicoccus roseus TaxID=2683649 RepID=A0A5R9JA07_9PROT|nr:glycosyltransferase [Lichenicoccus roseus]TLU72196.1 glycosyltransferase [Lichenicoccus roseus]